MLFYYIILLNHNYLPINLWALLHLSTEVGKNVCPILKAAAENSARILGLTFES